MFAKQDAFFKKQLIKEGAILVGFLDSENCRPSCNTLILRLLKKSMQFSPIHDRTIFIPAGPIGEEPAVEAVRQTGVLVESHVLEGWPHGFGVRGEWTTWFDNFLTEVMTNGASGTTNSNKGIRTYLSSHS